MSGADINARSKSDLERLDAMSDETIDTSDIPPLTEKFFATAKWRVPKPGVAVTVHVEPDVLDWFRAQGDNCDRCLAAALRIYAQAHQT